MHIGSLYWKKINPDIFGSMIQAVADARDDRPWGGEAPPGVAFTYAPGRSGQYADDILKGFTSFLQVDGYAGYNRLIQPERGDPTIQLAYCWAHARLSGTT